LDALKWFLAHIFPLILNERPQTALYVVGSDAPSDWTSHPSVRFLGSVPDVKVHLQRCSVFVCPILSGSGIRVKLLEAFASGIPCVSTKLGAEGLASQSGIVCELADDPASFATATLKLLADEEYGQLLARNARRLVEAHRDSRQAVTRLEALYRGEIARMRSTAASPSADMSDLDLLPVGRM
jgi:glycosyltransferase involved in cell wall biosynthesis